MKEEYDTSDALKRPVCTLCEKPYANSIHQVVEDAFCMKAIAEEPGRRSGNWRYCLRVPKHEGGCSMKVTVFNHPYDDGAVENT